MLTIQPVPVTGLAPLTEQCYEELHHFQIARQANAILHASRYFPVRQVKCDVRQRVLTLTGVVPNFYMKQIAQALLCNLIQDGFVIDNQIEVEANWKVR